MTNVRPKPGEFYRHFKGNLYQIITIAKHSENGEELVIYQALYGAYGVCARPLSMFISEVDHEKYPNSTQQFRFERVEQPEGMTADTPGDEQKKSVAETEPAKDYSGSQQESAGKAVQLSEEPFRQAEPEEGQASPELLAFLDADTYNEKYNVLKGMENTITDRLVNDFAVILDVVIPEGELSRRYEELKQCVATMARYESTRLR